MPTYEYVCQACSHNFELYQSITAKPVRKCPACGLRRVVRLIGTGSGVIFKGSGFYHTDYRSDQYKKAAKADTDKVGSGEKASSGTDQPASKPSSDKTTSAAVG